MNYQKHYNLLIDKAKFENRKKYLKSDLRYIYYEKHHILPVCLGGLNNSENLICLTPEEHYLAHLLLVKIYPGVDKLIFAVHRMCSGKFRNNKFYGWARRKHAETMSRLHKGKQMSETTKRKMSEARIGRRHSDESIRKMCLVQQNRSDEIRKNMSEAHIGHVISDETKEKIRIANIGKHHTDDTKKKMSLSKTGNKNHFYGKQHTAETKEKMKLAHQKRKLDKILHNSFDK